MKKNTFFSFENFEIILGMRKPTFLGGLFSITFYLSAPYSCFWFFEIVEGFFSNFFTFENSEIIFRIRMPSFVGLFSKTFVI